MNPTTSKSSHKCRKYYSKHSPSRTPKEFSDYTEPQDAIANETHSRRPPLPQKTGKKIQHEKTVIERVMNFFFRIIELPKPDLDFHEYMKQEENLDRVYNHASCSGWYNTIASFNTNYHPEALKDFSKYITSHRFVSSAPPETTFIDSSTVYQVQSGCGQMPFAHDPQFKETSIGYVAGKDGQTAQSRESISRENSTFGVEMRDVKERKEMAKIVDAVNYAFSVWTERSHCITLSKTCMNIHNPDYGVKSIIPLEFHGLVSFLSRVSGPHAMNHGIGIIIHFTAQEAKFVSAILQHGKNQMRKWQLAY